MIQSYGLIISLYLTFLLVPSNLRNGILNRSSKLFLISYLILEIDLYKHLEKSLVLQDGLQHIDEIILLNEIYQISQVLIILTIIRFKKSEIYLLILSSLVGMILQIGSKDWLVTITSWELINLSLYFIFSINSKKSESSLSSSIKYFLLSALTTTLMLLGITLLYGLLGSTNYDSIQILLSYLNPNDYKINIIYLLILISIQFKIGLAPFHYWVADVYDGLSTNITIWLASVPKIILFIFLIKLYPMIQINNNITLIIILIGSLSVINGSIGLGSQFKIRRFQGYSTISHMGIILQGFVSGYLDSVEYYLIIYGLTTINIFTILIVISNYKNKDISLINELSGIFHLNSGLSLSLAISLFSLAAIPPLAGFYAKLSIINSLFNLGYYWIGIIIILTSTISTANYLQIIKISHIDLPLYRVSLVVPKNQANIIAILTGFITLFILKPASFLNLLTFITF